MKVLSLTQPWASLICLGAKKIETRSWKSWYYGPLLIHASKSYPKWARETAMEEYFVDALTPHGVWAQPESVLGCIIGQVTLARCVPTTSPSLELDARELAFGDYSPGRWAWILEDGHFLPKPIPVKGSLGIWEYNTDPQTEADKWRVQ
jgi:hypothetical protein